MTGIREDFKVIGKSVPRVDAGEKVRGRARFTDDLSLPGMVHARILGAAHAHARIKNIDVSKAAAAPGVLAVVTGSDLPKPFSVNDHLPTEYALALDKVRYYGEGVAAVAALTPNQAEDALELIEVEYEPLPAVFDPVVALDHPEAVIHDFAPGNLHVDGFQEFGDVDGAMADAHVVVEESFKASYVNHAFLEPQASLADYDPVKEKMTLYSPIQLPHYAHQTIARTMDLPMEDVRIIVPFVGGGFGGKTELTPGALVACLLSRKLSRPVKVAYDRREVFYQNKGRHPAIMKCGMGFDADGHATAMDFETTLDGGAHSSWGLVVLWFSAALIQLPYKVPNIRFKGRRVYTNKPTCGAQRGLAGVQVRMAIEGVLDLAAAELGTSPADIRLINAVETGYKAPSVVEVRHSEFKQCVETAVEKSGYRDKHGQLPFGKGIGLAGAHYSTGGAFLLYRSFRSHSAASIRMDNEAGVTVFVGATDIGQGSCTVMSQMAAEVLGVDYMDINIICQDTTLAPMDNGTYDSRVTYGAGHAVKRAAEQVAGKLKDWAAVQMGVRPEHLALGQNEIYSTYDEKKRMSLSDAVAGYHNSVGPLFGEGEYTPPQPKGKYPGNLIGPSPAFGFTAQIAEVDVELDTGRVRVTTFHDAGDCGQPINPLSVEGQVEGGVSMGLGQALYEQMIIGPDGRMLNANLRDYKIVTARDMPEVKTYYIDSYDPTAPFGNKETGEGPTCGVIPAVLAAIEDAIGVRFTEIPVTPEKVLAALGKIKGV